MPHTLALLLLAPTLFLLTDPKQPSFDGVPDIHTIANAVRAQEELLLNLRIVAHRDSERWDDQAGGWTYAGEADIQVWLTGDPGSKARLDYDREVAPWLEGAAPFAENSSRTAFNGQVSKRLQTRIGSAGSASDVLRGELTAGVSAELNGALASESAWRFTALGASPNEQQGIRFSDYLALVARGRHRVKVFVPGADEPGSAGVRVVEPNGQQRIFYFDPGTGYTLVGGEFVWPTGRRSQWSAQELQHVAPGLYYPAMVVSEVIDAGGEPLERTTFRAAEIVANDPAWTDEVFDPPWPSGTIVEDKIAGTIYEIAPAPEQTEAAVDAQIGELLSKMRPQASDRDEAKQAPGAAPEDMRVLTPQPGSAPLSAESKPAPRAATQPTTRPKDMLVYSPPKARPGGTPDVEVLAPQTPSERPAPSRHYSKVLIALLGAGALGVIAVVVARGKRAGPLVLLLAVGLSRSSALDDRLLPLSLPQLGQQKLSNCGLNAAFLICRHFGAPSAVDELAADLGVGDHHERAASLLALKRAFLQRGLSVEGYRDARIEEITGALDGASLWLLHISAPDSPGHFYVLGGQRAEEVCWIDPAGWRRWMRAADLAAELEGKFDGWCLRVGVPGEKPSALQPEAAAPAVNWFPHDCNLGIISRERVASTRITITFGGDGRTPVQLVGCTDGLELARECVQRELSPDEKLLETKTYSFRLRERGVGPVEEALTFQAQSRDVQPIVVPVRGRVRAAPAEAGRSP